MQPDLRGKLRNCKDSYRRNLEAELKPNNISDVWCGKKISGFKVTASEHSMERAKSYTDSLVHSFLLPSLPHTGLHAALLQVNSVDNTPTSVKHLLFECDFWPD